MSDRRVMFLRGVNVGGNNLLKMSEVCARLEGRGLRNVKSYRASGNVLFDADDGEIETMRVAASEELAAMTGREIELFLRSVHELREMVARDPFAGQTPKTDTFYVAFLSGEPGSSRLPVKSPRGDIDVIGLGAREAFCLARAVDGKPADTGRFLRTLYGVESTTRNWNTVRGIADL